MRWNAFSQNIFAFSFLTGPCLLHGNTYYTEHCFQLRAKGCKRYVRHLSTKVRNPTKTKFISDRLTIGGWFHAKTLFFFMKRYQNSLFLHPKKSQSRWQNSKLLLHKSAVCILVSTLWTLLFPETSFTFWNKRITWHREIPQTGGQSQMPYKLTSIYLGIHKRYASRIESSPLPNGLLNHHK